METVHDDSMGGSQGQGLGVPTTCPGRWSNPWIPAGHLGVCTTGSLPRWSRYGWGPTLPWPDLRGATQQQCFRKHYH